MNLYKEEILDHYKHPHNFGDMADKTHSVRETNMACGDMVEMYLKVKDGVVEKAGFRGLGCALSTAMASMLTDEVAGKTVKEIESVKLQNARRQIAQAVDKQLNKLTLEQSERVLAVFKEISV